MKTRNKILLAVLSALAVITPNEAWKNAVQINPVDAVKSGLAILKSSPGPQGYSKVFIAAIDEGNTNNQNPEPPKAIYPKVDSGDVAYTIDETELRKSIHIPAEFTYGKIQPVLFIPGTGATAGRTFAKNFGKLFKRDKVADPVYVNIPYTSLNDVQTNSEYVAYAINYISALCKGKKVATISWSQGSLDGQWAFLHWPSTRSKVSDAIRLSPDIQGTVLTRIFGCPGIYTHGCVDSIAQQDFKSDFLKSLHSNGAGSAYVPSTHIYSLFDEIVQPQFGAHASGIINDTRGVGASNTQLQAACTAFTPGGALFNSHAGILHNSLAYALAVDALTHPGPADISRINVPFHCAQFAAEGLNLQDIFETAALIPLATIAIFSHYPKANFAPPMAAYVNKGVPQ